MYPAGPSREGLNELSVPKRGLRVPSMRSQRVLGSSTRRSNTIGLSSESRVGVVTRAVCNFGNWGAILASSSRVDGMRSII